MLGIKIIEVGSIIHISHPDSLRNQYHQHILPSQTRNQNIQNCLESLSHGLLWGDLDMGQLINTNLSDIYIKFPV